MRFQKQGHLLTAHAVVAERKDGLIPVDFGQSGWNLLHRDRDRCRTVQHYPRSGDFPGLPDVQQHRAQAEFYLLQGQLGQAVEQLQFAQQATDGNFYEQSAVDARLRELRKLQAEEDKLRRNGGG